MKATTKFEAYHCKCKQCGREDFNDRFVKTEEGDQICIHCLDPVRMELRKGLPTSSDVKQFYENKEAFDTQFLLLRQLIIKYSLATEDKESNVLKEVIKIRDDHSISKYRKEYSTMTILEKLHIIGLVSETLTSISNDKGLDLYKYLVTDSKSNGHFTNTYEVYFGV